MSHCGLVRAIELTKRQSAIVDIVKANGPITGENIAQMLHLTRATLRPDLSILTMVGVLHARPRVGYFFNPHAVRHDVKDTLNALSVRDCKSIPVVVSEKSSVYDAIVTMFTEDVGTLIVVKENRLQGVLSRKDLLKVSIGGGDLQSIPVNVVMTRIPHVVTIDIDASLYEAALKMVQREVDALPVTKRLHGGELEVVGRVSKTTVARAFVDLGEP